MTSEHQSSLPHFVIIGASSAGTTDLSAWLDGHRDVCMSPREGLDFFVEDGTWDRGIGWYALRFGACMWEQTRGESSPSYADTHRDAGIPKRMRSVIPDARLVYVVREPIERMRSMYRQAYISGTETRGFREAIAEDEHYIESSRYMQHIAAYLKEYSKDRILVVTTEALMTEPDATLGAVYEHIGVSQSSPGATAGDRRVTVDQRLDSDLSRRLKANPGYWRALNKSNRLRNLHERVFTRKGQVPSTQLPQSVNDELRSDLEKDTADLELFIGRKLAEWGR